MSFGQTKIATTEPCLGAALALGVALEATLGWAGKYSARRSGKLYKKRLKYRYLAFSATKT